MRNWPLVLTVLIALFGFGHGMSAMITPEMYREMSPPELGWVFVPDDDTFVDSQHQLEIRFVQFGPEAPSRVTAWIQRSREHGEPEPLEFEPLKYQGKPTDSWIAILPPLADKGERWFYYITIETTEARTIEIWKRMNWFEQLWSGFSKQHQHFWVTYEGNIAREMPLGKLVLVAHIVLSFGALLLLFHTVYNILRILAQPENASLVKAYRTTFWAWLSFTVGAIFLGIPITWYTFKVGFMPWPTQGLADLGDITDTKSTWLSICWLVLVCANLPAYRAALKGDLEPSSQRRFAWWTIVVLLLTVFVFLIPHSQFL